jgi:hypothetical protein
VEGCTIGTPLPLARTTRILILTDFLRGTSG